ncbi:MAG: sulfurtransferase TusA family protein [Planctomycetes bacterium]|nr:sulfurtransferase TusA family protein [Planctomycetota bacterium]
MAAQAARPVVPVRTVDVTGSRCPMTFVRVKVALDGLAPGEVLELVLLEGEQMQDVPKNLKDEGHRVLAVVRKGPKYHLLVRKGEP